jgi:hypothetical protein
VVLRVVVLLRELLRGRSDALEVLVWVLRQVLRGCVVNLRALIETGAFGCLGVLVGLREGRDACGRTVANAATACVHTANVGDLSHLHVGGDGGVDCGGVWGGGGVGSCGDG